MPLQRYLYLWVAIAFFYNIAFASRCAVIYDPQLHGETAPWTSLIENINDNDCQSLILVPPIPSLGYLSADGLYQTLPLNEENRKEFTQLLSQKDVELQLKKARVSPLTIRKLIQEIPSASKPDKVIYNFHGYASVMAPGPSWEPKFYNTDSKKALTEKAEWTEKDILTYFDGNLEALEYVKTTWPPVKSKAGTYANRCASVAQSDQVKLKSDYYQKFTSLKKDADALATMDFSRDGPSSCKGYRKLKEAYFNLIRASGDAECSDLLKAVKAHYNKNQCLVKYLRPNLLQEALFKVGSPGAVYLVDSCALASEQLISSDEHDYLGYLVGCTKEKEEFKDFVGDSRKGSSQNLANDLCKDKKDSYKFTLAVDLTFSAIQQPKHTSPVAEELSEGGEKDKFQAEQILRKWVASCEPHQLRPLRNSEASWQLFNHASHSHSNPKEWMIYEVRQRQHELSCLPAKQVFGKEELDDLRHDLAYAHLALFAKSVHKPNAFKAKGDDDFLYGPQPDPAVEKSQEGINAQIKSLYEHLDLDSLPKVQRAYQRLEYLLEQMDEGWGFYDCYSCENGKAINGSCAEMQNKFSHFLYIGDRDTYEKYKDPEQFAKIIEKSVADAEKTPPPVCSPRMPVCDFAKDPQCTLKIPEHSSPQTYKPH